MATQQDVIETARNFLRDFPRFFQVTRPKIGYTYQLGHRNVAATGLWVATDTGGTATQLTAEEYVIRERDGVLRIDSSVALTGVDNILVEGDYYEWLTPDDLTFYSQHAIDLVLSGLQGVSISNASAPVVDAVAMSTVVHALWGLLTEFSRDVDVIASESVHIPASQRFRMVQSLLTQWEAEYKALAQALNIGVERIEVFNLRRRSRTTERLVPLYREREIGDFGPLERVWTETADGKIELVEPEDDLREDVYVDGEPPEGLTNASYFPGYNSVYY